MTLYSAFALCFVLLLLLLCKNVNLATQQAAAMLMLGWFVTVECLLLSILHPDGQCIIISHILCLQLLSILDTVCSFNECNAGVIYGIILCIIILLHEYKYSPNWK